jgi:hypothetical protein
MKQRGNSRDNLKLSRFIKVAWYCSDDTIKEATTIYIYMHTRVSMEKSRNASKILAENPPGKRKIMSSGK